MHIVINASNLHVGGGVQVAASFIEELFYLGEFDVSIICSSTVMKQLTIPTDSFSYFKVVNIIGIMGRVDKEVLKHISNCDVFFTVFGPLYQRIPAKRHVVGFAVPWILYPDNDVYQMLSFWDAIKKKIEFLIKKKFFKNADFLIVEANHVHRSLVEQGFSKNKVEVVNNTPSTAFRVAMESIRKPNLFGQRRVGRVRLGYLGRNYLHKNLSILKDVSQILSSKGYGIVDFCFSLTDEEMKESGFDKLEHFYSCGALTVEECPSFYDAIDAVIFPSLLECFSATPIEAALCRKPLICSSRNFLTELCKDYPYYFSPTSAESIASAIIAFIDDMKDRQGLEINNRIQIGQMIIADLNTARSRAEKYMHILKKISL